MKFMKNLARPLLLDFAGAFKKNPLIQTVHQLLVNYIYLKNYFENCNNTFEF